ncbi:hypothetical protein L195_g035181, partial [Trifolium pratense]
RFSFPSAIPRAKMRFHRDLRPRYPPCAGASTASQPSITPACWTFDF